MKTLLELSYQKCPDVDLPSEIRWKIVNLARQRIKRALQKQKTQIILKTLYMFRTTNVDTTIQEMIGSFQQYRGGLWRIAALHACCSFVHSKPQDRQMDIVDTINIYLPSYAIEERDKVIEAMLLLRPDDLSSLIEAYLAFGDWLIFKKD